MVGVPGRSKACNICKQRRISCDQRKPQCGQCAKSNRQCDFSKTRIFVLNEEGSHKAVYRHSTGKKTVSRTPLSQRSDEHNNSDNGALNPSVALISQAPTSALIQQQLVSYAISTPDSLSYTYSNSFQWTSVLAACSNLNEPLLYSPLACWMTLSSRNSKDPVKRQLSRYLYLKGLSETHAALRNKSRALEDQTLASCLALATYEALECPNEALTAYRWHREGFVRLIQLQGVHQHKLGLGHGLFVAARVHIILQACEQRRPTYLLSDDWLKIPWSLQPKSHYDRPLDIFARGPTIYSQAEQLDSLSPDEAASTLSSMWTECWAVDRALQSYFDELQSANPGLLYWEHPRATVAKDILQTDKHSLSDNVIKFQTPELGRILTLYWAIQSMVWAGTLDLYSALRPGAKQQPLLTRENGESMYWLEPVRRILKSIDFDAQNSTYDVELLHVGTPLSIVIDIMKYKTGCTKEYEVANFARKEIGRRCASIMHYSV